MIIIWHTLNVLDVVLFADSIFIPLFTADHQDQPKFSFHSGFWTKTDNLATSVLLVHGQVPIIFLVSVGLSVCLFVCLLVQSFSQPSLIRFRSN